VVKRGRSVTLTTHPHLVAEVKYEQELYLPSPHAPPWRVAGQLYIFFSDSRFAFILNQQRKSTGHYIKQHVGDYPRDTIEF
jgi:hypothetical protein